MSEKIMVYGSPVCGMVPPVRGVLDRAGASYEYVDISRDDVARQRVREINEGIESVPTLEFPDGDTLTEPSLRELEEKLAALCRPAPRPGATDWRCCWRALPFSSWPSAWRWSAFSVASSGCSSLV